MAITITTLQNGPRNVILHVYVQGAEDLTDYELVDPADFGMTGDDRFFTIEEIKSSLVGFSAALKFEYLLSDTLIWAIPEYDSCFDFTSHGGLKDRSNILDGTGKVLFSTKGLSTGDEGSFILKLKK